MKKNKLLLIVGVLLGKTMMAQFSVSGKVTAENGVPLAWANVFIKETKYVVVTNTNGEFTFSNVSGGNYQVSASYTGYNHKTVKLNLTKNIEGLEFNLTPKNFMADELVVSATRVSEKTPAAFTDVSKKQIEEQNLGQDIPFLLQTTPSLVVNSDAGGGVGYTGMRIRGTDATRINVTVNGIPLNDAESHGVWWVNMPDLASSLESIQIQRGAGTSTNGAGAFGASINLLTNTLNDKAYGEINNSFGSFNTMKNTIKFGTGLINKHFSIDGRLSSLQSDGYIDRASSDLKSYYLSGQYVDEKNSLKLITFAGHEKTYQAWGGVPKDSLKTNRTFNPYTYKNEVDDYQQTHYQLHFNRFVNDKVLLNIGLHYTKGQGFFEQYKEGEDLADYSITPAITANDTITNTDLIRRRWLDNDFYGTVFSLIYEPTNKTKITFGGGWNQHDGDHFGEVIWARFASNSEIRDKYYKNNAIKTDMNAYAKFNHQITRKLNGFIDLQVRSIDYSFLGFDDSLNNIQQTARYTFFNPKVGLNYSINSSTRIYTLFSVANKEPNRDDLTESSSLSRPQHESLYDVELGFKTRKQNYTLGINGYYMSYNNQLIPTGELNDVGASVRTNIKDSYRAGIEIEGGVKITKGLSWTGNLTVSQNKITDWTEYVDNWDTWGKDTVKHSNKSIAFSPNLIASSVIEFNPYKQFDGERMENRIDDLTISFISKYVGEQFIDNTQSEDRKLDAYLVHDLRINYTVKFKTFQVQLFGTINNVFSNLYSANGWVYRYSSGGEFNQSDGYFPQAERNFLVGLNFKF
jgi:iron complex outermembrane receptor protein